jgi:hypothetical protein
MSPLSGLIPIAHDPGGNMVCLAVTGEKMGKIFFWDHEGISSEEETYGHDNIFWLFAFISG